VYSERECAPQLLLESDVYVFYVFVCEPLASLLVPVPVGLFSKNFRGDRGGDVSISRQTTAVAAATPANMPLPRALPPPEAVPAGMTVVITSAVTLHTDDELARKRAFLFL
jgi:hypothetical protein